ncbi:hypothetical protein NHX12_017158 [Muraenolepis orangiensis]|uniref:Uncharacterized protein n=1 Tax=Muraenolepis orangiensis TaxID=630683 RepID=A0A9Q0I0G1_9TELE|nr:hypothetical protein NHX12_017158 [Muraenolepis orangiensis]
MSQCEEDNTVLVAMATKKDHRYGSVDNQVVSAPNYNWSERILEKLSIPNLMSQDVPNPPPDFYTCSFRTSKLDR